MTANRRGSAVSEENRLVGEVAGFRQPGNGRRRGARAGADGGAGKAQHGAVHCDAVRPAEAAVADEHVHAEAGEPLGGIDAAEARPQPPHAGHDGAEVALHRAGKRQAEFAAAGHRGPGARGPDEPLRRDAADVEAVAPHQVALDHRHPRAEPGAHRRHDQAGRPGADDDEVVASGRLGIAPRRRMDVGDERPVVLVVGCQERRGVLFPCGHGGFPSAARDRPLSAPSVPAPAAAASRAARPDTGRRRTPRSRCRSASRTYPRCRASRRRSAASAGAGCSG